MPKTNDWEAANRTGRAIADAVITDWRAEQCSPSKLRFTVESLKGGEAAGYWQAIAEATRYAAPKLRKEIA